MLSAYRQIRNQERPILADIEEDNFDRAFDLFRPGGIISIVIINPELWSLRTCVQ